MFLSVVVQHSALLFLTSADSFSLKHLPLPSLLFSSLFILLAQTSPPLRSLPFIEHPAVTPMDLNTEHSLRYLNTWNPATWNRGSAPNTSMSSVLTACEVRVLQYHHEQGYRSGTMLVPIFTNRKVVNQLKVTSL